MLLIQGSTICKWGLEVANRRLVSTTCSTALIQKWRQERGLPLNPNTCGVLTDAADYTHVDGKPTPYGVGQRNRILKQKELAAQIIQLSAEVDFAVDRHKHLLQEEQKRKDEIIRNKLKPKGIALLKKKKGS